MATGSNDLRTFLRARRAQVVPPETGAGTRRVAGLRREEVAERAGISVDYYVRLEQGRERFASEQVLAGLARALELGSDAAEHLRRIGRPGGADPGRDDAVETEASASLLALLDSWDKAPAMLLDSRFYVLARNDLCRSLFDDLANEDNILRLLFLEPRARIFYRDWEASATASLASLRALHPVPEDDEALGDLVGEFDASEDFSRLWARHDVAHKSSRRRRFEHPRVGTLELTYETFRVNGTQGQQLVVYYAEPGSRSEAALVELADERPERS